MTRQLITAGSGKITHELRSLGIMWIRQVCFQKYAYGILENSIWSWD